MTNIREDNGLGKMRKILVYSCVSGDYDDLARSLYASECFPEDNVRFVLFTNTNKEFCVGTKSGVQWRVKPLLWKHPSCNRRTARWHKVNSHLIPGDHEVAVWIDGTHCVKKISVSSQLVEASIGSNTSASLFTFKHPIRCCVYQELDACIRYNKDNPHLMHTQVASYRQEGYPELNGMVETGCVLRKVNQSTALFNSEWWAEIQKYSFRDQLSFNYVAWKSNFRYGILPGSGTESPFFRYVKHKNHA